MRHSNQSILTGFLTIKLFAICLLVFHGFAVEPQRVIAIGPSVNSIIKGLNAQNQVIGVDTQSISQYPKTVSNIGYMRAVSLEGLLSLKPDLCIATNDTSPHKVIEDLGKYKVKTVTTSKITTPDSVYQNIMLIGNALGNSEAAYQLKNKVMIEATGAIKLIPPHTRQKVLFLLQISPDNVFALGTNTHADWWLKFIQMDNIVKFNGMRPLSKEGFMALTPDVIMVAKVNSQFQLPYKVELETYAKKHKVQIITLNSQILDGFGADFGENTALLVRQVYHVR